MNILAAIKSEERNIEQHVRKLHKRLDALKAAGKLLSGSATDGVGMGQKRGMSAEARAKISAAAKKRWAQVRAGSNRVTRREDATDGSGKPQRRVMSAAARAKISAAMKKRWANTKAGSKRAVS